MIDFEFYQLSNNYQLNIVNSFAIKLLSPPLSETKELSFSAKTDH